MEGTEQQVKAILADVLGLGARINEFNANTPLLGSIPELDSMAVVSVMTALEDKFGFTIDDDEVGARTFSTLGALTQFVDQKMTASA